MSACTNTIIELNIMHSANRYFVEDIELYYNSTPCSLLISCNS